MQALSSEPRSLNVDSVKIGPAHHLTRRLWITAGLVLGVVAVVAFYSYVRKQNVAEMAQLERFRSAYAEKCNAPNFVGPVPSIVRDLYLNSSTVQAVIDRQTAAMERGDSCESVAKALRTADFSLSSAISKPAAETSTITLYPSIP